MSAGDRDTLTDAEIEHIQAAIMGTDDPWYALEKAVESIVAARVRAAQTQAWEESCRDHYGDGHYSGLDSCPRNPYRLGWSVSVRVPTPAHRLGVVACRGRGGGDELLALARVLERAGFAVEAMMPRAVVAVRTDA